MPDEHGAGATAAENMLRFLLRGERVQRALTQQAFHRWEFPDGTPWTTFHRQGGNYLLRFPGLADFEVSADGRDIEGWPAPGVKAATVHHLYLNQVLPLALSRLGKLVLHASAVEIGRGCVAFIGASGRGKSTLAASFASSGTRFLTDDGLQLEWQDGMLMALPSHPSIRLWDDSQLALVGDTEILAPAVEYTTKARVLAGPGLAFCDEPRPVRAIYLLGLRDVAMPTITPVNPVTALIDLVRHSFLLDIDAQEMLASHFDEVSRIANLPIHYQLDYPRHYDGLSGVRQALMRHALEQG